MAHEGGGPVTCGGGSEALEVDGIVLEEGPVGHEGDPVACEKRTLWLAKKGPKAYEKGPCG